MNTLALPLSRIQFRGKNISVILCIYIALAGNIKYHQDRELILSPNLKCDIWTPYKCRITPVASISKYEMQNEKWKLRNTKCTQKNVHPSAAVAGISLLNFKSKLLLLRSSSKGIYLLGDEILILKRKKKMLVAWHGSSILIYGNIHCFHFFRNEAICVCSGWGDTSYKFRMRRHQITKKLLFLRSKPYGGKHAGHDAGKSQ